MLIPLLSVPIVLSVAHAHIPAPVPTPVPTPVPIPGAEPLPQSEATIGFEFEGSRDLNRATILTTQYTGDCPGTNTSQLTGYFLSSKTRPAPGLRAVIRNLTRGMGGDIKPYTDREYEKGDRSEFFYAQLATRHAEKFLAVLPGVNDFEYEIKRGTTVVESGRFSAEIGRQFASEVRSGRLVSEEYCYSNPGVTLSRDCFGRNRDSAGNRCPCKTRNRGTRLVNKCPGMPGYSSGF